MLMLLCRVPSPPLAHQPPAVCDPETKHFHVIILSRQDYASPLLKGKSLKLVTMHNNRDTRKDLCGNSCRCPRKHISGREQLMLSLEDIYAWYVQEGCYQECGKKS